MRVVFCGSGTFATPSLQAIQGSAHEVVCVVTQPPRRAGRGGKVKETKVASFAREANLPLLELANINAPDSVSALEETKPDIICVAQYGQMIRQRICRLARLDTFNLHGSLLPELRGAAPVNWALIRGMDRTGVTTFSLVDKMDAGPMYFRREVDIEPGERAESLLARLAEVGADVVMRTIDALADGTAVAVEQDHGRATFAPMLTKADGVIDWYRPAEELEHRIRGTWPWPGGQAKLRRADGKEVEMLIASAIVMEDTPGAGEPGTLDADLAVRTGRGRLLPVEVKPAGKRLMGWRDFANGYRIQAGDRFEDKGRLA